MPELSSFSEVLFSLSASADNSAVPKILYSRRDAAFALSISVRSLDYIIAAKELKFRKIGKKVLIPASELSRYARADHAALTKQVTEPLVM